MGVEDGPGEDGRREDDETVVRRVLDHLSTLGMGLRFGRLATEAVLGGPGNEADRLIGSISAGVMELGERLREARNGGSNQPEDSNLLT